MIKVTLMEESKRTYVVKRDEKEIVKLDLMCNPATNKFNQISEYIEDCSNKLGKEFDDWFEQYLTEYIQSNYDYMIIKNHLPKMTEMVEKHLSVCGVNFEDYINKDKISKNSIFFDAEEIKKLIKVSNCLKLYFVIGQESSMKLPVKFHKEIYGMIVKDITDRNILYKLFKIVSSKVYKYNLTDGYMWEYIKTIYCKTTDIHILHIFNFIVNNTLVTCNSYMNPITYIITVINGSIGYMLQGVYKEEVTQKDSITTEDATMMSKDNLKNYSYNDTIGRLASAAYNCLEIEGISNITFNEAITKCNYEQSIISAYITYPILCKTLKIPYKHLMTIPAQHGYLLNVLLYSYLPKEFKEKYPILAEMMLYYNKEKIILKTTYKIKNFNYFSETLQSFMGFPHKIFPYEFYSNIVGKLARNSYVSFKTGKELTNFQFIKVENNIIGFYNAYFQNQLEKMYADLRIELNKLL